MHGGERTRRTLNLGTGLANALIDCCPVVAFGGSSPISQFGRQVFQEIDQVKAIEGCVKYADRVHNLKRIPQQVNFAFQKALSGKPGPVYLDFPGDVLYLKIDESRGRLELYAAGRSSRRAPMPSQRRSMRWSTRSTRRDSRSSARAAA